MADTTSQTQSSGQQSSNYQAARDITVYSFSPRWILNVVALLALAAYFVLWWREDVSFPRWPMSWRKVLSDDLADVVIDLDQKYQAANIDPENRDQWYLADGVNDEFTEKYQRYWGRVIWTGVIESANASDRSLRMRLTDAAKAEIDRALGADRKLVVAKRTVVSCTFADGCFDKTITPGKTVSITGQVVRFQRPSIILTSCQITSTTKTSSSVAKPAKKVSPKNEDDTSFE